MSTSAPYLSLREASRAFRINRQLLSDAIYRGELPASRIGRGAFRLRPSDVDRWLRTRHAVRPAEGGAVAAVEARLAREA